MFFKLKILTEILKSILKPNFKNRKSLEQFQKAKVDNQLNFFTNNIDYYKNYKGKELEQFPIINKKIMMEHFDELNLARIKKKDAINIAIKAEQSRNFSPQINNITIGLSSGTSGNKSIFLASEKERAKYVGAIFKKVLFPLKHFNTKVALFFRANSNLYESVGSMLIKFKYFDLTGELESQINELNNYLPHILVAPPTLLMILASKQEAGVLNINPDKIISVAEVLEEDVRIKIEAVFSKTVHQLYQCTEGFLASTCKFGKLHLHEDYIHFEKKWLDDKRERFHPIITDFSRTTQAMIRYELNDILHIGGKCKCGSNFTMIEKIEGRSDDVFYMRDNEEIIIFPDQIRNTIIISSEKISNYQVIQTSKNNITVSLLFNEIENADIEKEKVLKALKEMFLSKGLKLIEINEEKWKTPKLEIKFRRIINNSKQV